MTARAAPKPRQLHLLIPALLLGGCTRHLSSTDRFILGEIAQEHLQNIGWAMDEARKRCGSEIEPIPEWTKGLLGGEMSEDYRCAHPKSE